MTINQILQETKNLNWKDRFKFAAKSFSNITFSTSFSIEDQVITNFIIEENLPIEIFTLDTGRLHKETHDVWQNTLEKYKVKISAFYPDAEEIGNFVNKNGINAFYDNKDLRLSCCAIRKINPLKKALKGKELWISGLRKEHSQNRLDKDFFEEDKAFGVTKFYPILELSEEEVWQEINEKRIPFNRLYKSGYRSIGCAPCTRAIGEDEDPRAGRWWWEDNSKKECGLHRG